MLEDFFKGCKFHDWAAMPDCTNDSHRKLEGSNVSPPMCDGSYCDRVDDGCGERIGGSSFSGNAGIGGFAETFKVSNRLWP